MEAMWTAFLPHFQYVQQLLKNKYFGNVMRLEADFGFFPEYDKTSRLFDKSIGGGSLLDIGIYPIFAALSTLGKPDNIKAKANFFETGADAECEITFNYHNANANLKCTLLEETKTEAVWTCEQGTIKINSRFHEPSTVTLIDKRNTSELKLFDYETLGYSYEIEHFNQLIRTGNKESDIMSFNKSIELISTLDVVRRIIDLEY